MIRIDNATHEVTYGTAAGKVSSLPSVGPSAGMVYQHQPSVPVLYTHPVNRGQVLYAQPHPTQPFFQKPEPGSAGALAEQMQNVQIAGYQKKHPFGPGAIIKAEHLNDYHAQLANHMGANLQHQELLENIANQIAPRISVAVPSKPPFTGADGAAFILAHAFGFAAPKGWKEPDWRDSLNAPYVPGLKRGLRIALPKPSPLFVAAAVNFGMAGLNFPMAITGHIFNDISMAATIGIGITALSLLRLSNRNAARLSQ